MGTTQKTNQQLQFAPAGMSTYNQMLGPGTGTGGGFGGGMGGFGPPGPGSAGPGPMGAAGTAGSAGGGLGNVTANYINNPFGNPFFQTQQQMGTRQAQNLGGTNISNMLRNFQTGGLGGGSGTMAPFQQEMLQNQARANTGLQAQLGFLNPVQNALGMQQNAMGLAAGYRPLQTGGTTTQSTGGLGTWLPQVAGMALGGLTGGLGGGLGSALGGLFGGGGGGGMPVGGTSGMMDTAMNAFNNANPSFMGGGAFGEGAGALPFNMSGYGMQSPMGGGMMPPPPPPMG
jgi:hypothetical protein